MTKVARIMAKAGEVVIAVYSHPEAYPPTLNAIELLARDFQRITVVCRNILPTEWKYPANVAIKTSGPFISFREMEQKGFMRKLLSFLQFTFTLARTILKKKPALLLFCDPFPLLSYRLIKGIISSNCTIWYHNHDVTQPGAAGKISLGYLVEKNEPKIFKSLDIFSLPAMDRVKFFPMKDFKGKFLFLPNFPSIHFYKNFYKGQKTIAAHEPMRIIFQGSVGTGHGLEEIISILDQPICGKRLEIVIKGFIRKEYMQQLVTLAEQHNVKDRLTFIGVTPYQEVPAIASTCHVGIGIHMATDRMNATLGTASNKIYEYAALGLPVLVFDNPHFRSHLEKYKWVYFTDCTRTSLKKCLTEIFENYQQLSNKAHEDFMDELNFENYFSKAMTEVKQLAS